MSLSVKLNRSKAADFIIAMLAMTPAVVIYYHSLSPDAAVYFTYIRNFFHLPFSYQPDTVAFGATSPLHVLIHAPVYAIFGQYWLPISKFLNLLFITCGMVLINRALRGGTKTVLLISLLVAVSTALLVSAAQMFETGLAFLAMAWLYHDLVQKKHNSAAAISGLLYLIRPELFFVTVATLIYILVHSEERKKIILITGVAFIPAVIYHIYMLASSGSPLPGSAFAPILSYIHDPHSWLQRLGISLSSLWSASGLIYIAGVVTALLLVAERSAGRFSLEFLLAAPLIVLYIIFPPQDAIARYLVPIVPMIIAMIVRYVQQNLKAQYTVNALVVCLILAHGYGIAARSNIPNESRGTILLQDLSGGLNKIASQDDPVLLDEVQGQYYINAPCYSLDASVGNQMLDVLLKRSTMTDFIRDKNVKYVVTNEPWGDRGHWSNELMTELHRSDYGSKPGDTVYVDGIAFEKALMNPDLVPPTPGYDHMRAKPAPTRLWNSVYAVLGDEASIRAELAVRQQQMAVTDSVTFQMQNDPTMQPARPDLAQPVQPTQPMTQPTTPSPAQKQESTPKNPSSSG